MSDSPVLAFLNKLTDLILLNVLCIICCLPVVTIGASITAAYYVCIISIRNGDGYVTKRFFKSFKENFKNATIIWLIEAVLIAIFFVDIRFWQVSELPFSKMMFVVSIVMAIIVGLVASWIFPVIAKLDGGVLDTIKNSAKFSVGYLQYSVIINGLNALFIWANLHSVTMNAVSLFVGFAVLIYVKSFFYYKVFMNHIDESYDDFYTEEET